MQIFAQRDGVAAETDPHRLIPFLSFPLSCCLSVLPPILASHALAIVIELDR